MIKVIRTFIKKMFKDYKETEIGYDRKKAKAYAEKYALKPNKKQYPYYKGKDCTNFASQVLHAGGMKYRGTEWNNVNCWFCKTNSLIQEKGASKTWRVAKDFRNYWKNINEIKYREVSIEYATQNFNNIYNFLEVGDIVQYAYLLNNNKPFHTQVIHKKGFNSNIGRTDLIMAQHTSNKKNISLYQYLVNIKDKTKVFLYIYKINTML